MSFHRQSLSRWLQRSLLFPLGLLSVLLSAVPAKSADTIHFQYGQLNQSLQVSSLEVFAETGEIRPDLKFYFNFLQIDEQAQQEFRQALTARSQVDVVYLSRFLYTRLGADFLSQSGSYIRTEAGNNGQYALRSAVLLAAAKSDGLSLLNVLQQYPTDIRINVQAGLDLSRAFQTVIDATNFFTTTIAQLSESEAKNTAPVNFAQLADLRQRGSYGVQRRRWQLQDEKRDRSFYVDVYRPQRRREGQIPVIVMSHGLASDPESFVQRAEYLSSYGYVVAVPQHPGSDAAQAQNVVDGLSRNLISAQEFVDRPLDVSYVLDELERRNAREFGNRLNLRLVGVVGHSFGGYTALALAGATIDFNNLQDACQNNLEYLNISLFLQCRALDLPRQNYNLRDARVTAVYASNPVNNNIFGETGLSQITVPVLLEAGTYDPATPAVFEQVRSFRMLTTPNKYLVLLEGQAHVDFSQLDAGLSHLVQSVSSLTLPPPQLLNTYSESLTLAFFEVFLLGDNRYQPYLQASYTDYLSRNQEFKVFLISTASEDELEQAGATFRGDATSLVSIPVPTQPNE